MVDLVYKAFEYRVFQSMVSVLFGYNMKYYAYNNVLIKTKIGFFISDKSDSS